MGEYNGNSLGNVSRLVHTYFLIGIIHLVIGLPKVIATPTAGVRNFSTPSMVTFRTPWDSDNQRQRQRHDEICSFTIAGMLKLPTPTYGIGHTNGRQ